MIPNRILFCLIFTGMLLSSPALASFLPTAVNGNIGINSASPRGKLDVDGALYATSLWIDTTIYGDGSHLTGMISGTLSSGKVPVASGTSSLVDSAIYGSAGNVGVGSASPRSALDVNGTASLRTVVLVPTAATQTITAGGGV